MAKALFIVTYVATSPVKSSTSENTSNESMNDYGILVPIVNIKWEVCRVSKLITCSSMKVHSFPVTSATTKQNNYQTWKGTRKWNMKKFITFVDIASSEQKHNQYWTSTQRQNMTKSTKYVILEINVITKHAKCKSWKHTK